MSELVEVNESSLAAFENIGSEIGNASDMSYLKFNKAGRFVSGADEEEIESGRQFAINIAKLSRGYICWKDGVVAGEAMAKVMGEPAINPSNLPDYGPYEDKDGWKPQVRLELTAMDTQTLFEFKSSSRGGISAIDKLGKDFASQVRTGSKDLIPVVTLRGGSYKHKNKTIGTIYTPHFDVVEWIGTAARDVVEGDILN